MHMPMPLLMPLPAGSTPDATPDATADATVTAADVDAHVRLGVPLDRRLARRLHEGAPRGPGRRLQAVPVRRTQKQTTVARIPCNVEIEKTVKMRRAPGFNVS